MLRDTVSDSSRGVPAISSSRQSPLAQRKVTPDSIISPRLSLRVEAKSPLPKTPPGAAAAVSTRRSPRVEMKSQLSTAARNQVPHEGFTAFTCVQLIPLWLAAELLMVCALSLLCSVEHRRHSPRFGRPVPPFQQVGAYRARDQQQLADPDVLLTANTNYLCQCCHRSGTC